MPKILFAVSNSSKEQVSIASIIEVYPQSQLQAHLDSYLQLSKLRLNPGEANIATMFLPTNEPPWQFELAYNSRGLKERLMDGLGGQETIIGRNAGAMADFLTPTQKRRWIHTEWSGNAAVLNACRFHITAQPPPFKLDWLTINTTSGEVQRDQ